MLTQRTQREGREGERDAGGAADNSRSPFSDNTRKGACAVGDGAARRTVELPRHVYVSALADAGYGR